MRNLFLHNLLPPSLMQAEDFLKGVVPISPISGLTPKGQPKQDTTKREGLLSTLTQLLSISGPNDDDDYYLYNEENLEFEKRAAACIGQLHLDGIFEDVRYELLYPLLRLVVV